MGNSLTHFTGEKVRMKESYGFVLEEEKDGQLARVFVDVDFGKEKAALLSLSKVVHFTLTEVTMLFDSFRACREGTSSSPELLWSYLTHAKAFANCEVPTNVAGCLCECVQEAELINFGAATQVLSTFARGSCEEQLAYLFSVLDSDGSGFIVRPDLEILVAMYLWHEREGCDAEAQEKHDARKNKVLDQILAVLDPNEKHQISYEHILHNSQFLSDSLGMTDVSALQPTEGDKAKEAVALKEDEEGKDEWETRRNDQLYNTIRLGLLTSRRARKSITEGVPQPGDDFDPSSPLSSANGLAIAPAAATPGGGGTTAAAGATGAAAAVSSPPAGISVNNGLRPVSQNSLQRTHSGSGHLSQGMSLQEAQTSGFVSPHIRPLRPGAAAPSQQPLPPSVVVDMARSVGSPRSPRAAAAEGAAVSHTVSFEGGAAGADEMMGESTRSPTCGLARGNSAFPSYYSHRTSFMQCESPQQEGLDLPPRRDSKETTHETFAIDAVRVNSGLGGNRKRTTSIMLQPGAAPSPMSSPSLRGGMRRRSSSLRRLRKRIEMQMVRQPSAEEGDSDEECKSVISVQPYFGSTAPGGADTLQAKGSPNAVSLVGKNGGFDIDSVTNFQLTRSMSCASMLSARRGTGASSRRISTRPGNAVASSPRRRRRKQATAESSGDGSMQELARLASDGSSILSSPRGSKYNAKLGSPKELPFGKPGHLVDIISDTQELRTLSVQSSSPSSADHVGDDALPPLIPAAAAAPPDAAAPGAAAAAAGDAGGARVGSLGGSSVSPKAMLAAAMPPPPCVSPHTTIDIGSPAPSPAGFEPPGINLEISLLSNSSVSPSMLGGSLKEANLGGSGGDKLNVPPVQVPLSPSIRTLSESVSESEQGSPTGAAAAGAHTGGRLSVSTAESEKPEDPSASSGGGGVPASPSTAKRRRRSKRNSSKGSKAAVLGTEATSSLLLSATVVSSSLSGGVSESDLTVSDTAPDSPLTAGHPSDSGASDAAGASPTGSTGGRRNKERSSKDNAAGGAGGGGKKKGKRRLSTSQQQLLTPSPLDAPQDPSPDPSLLGGGSPSAGWGGSLPPELVATRPEHPPLPPPLATPSPSGGGIDSRRPPLLISPAALRERSDSRTSDAEMPSPNTRNASGLSSLAEGVDGRRLRTINSETRPSLGKVFSDSGKGAKLSHLTYDSSDEEVSEKKVRGMSVPPLIPVASQAPSTRLPPPRETWGSPSSPSVSHDSFEEQPPPLRSEDEGGKK